MINKPEQSFFFLIVFYFIFWLHWVFVAFRGLSLVMESRGYSPVTMLQLLIALASLVAEHRL